MELSNKIILKVWGTLFRTYRQYQSFVHSQTTKYPFRRSIYKMNQKLMRKWMNFVNTPNHQRNYIQSQGSNEVRLMIIFIIISNGRYACDAKNLDVADLIANLHGKAVDNFKTLAPGTTCRVHCNRSYSIPYHLYSLSVIQCANGSWNTTDIEYCYKKEPQRRHLRHKNRPH